MKFAAVVLYIGVMLGVIALVDAGTSEAVLIWSAASFGLGWVTRWPWLAILPWLASLIAVPFGYPEEWSGHDALPLWFGLLFAAFGEAVLVLAGWGGRRLYERSRAARA